MKKVTYELILAASSGFAAIYNLVLWYTGNYPVNGWFFRVFGRLDLEAVIWGWLLGSVVILIHDGLITRKEMFEEEGNTRYYLDKDIFKTFTVKQKAKAILAWWLTELEVI